MGKGYAYLSFEGEGNLDLFLRMMGRLLQDEVSASYKGNGHVLLAFDRPTTNLAIFSASFEALCLDNPGIHKALILPSPSPIFYEALEYVEEKRIDTLAHLSLEHPELLYELLGIFDQVDEDDIEATLAYVATGGSPSAASLGIYVHKNTVCNRVKKFVGATGIDLTLFPNQLFVYLLGNIWRKTRTIPS